MKNFYKTDVLNHFDSYSKPWNIDGIDFNEFMNNNSFFITFMPRNASSPDILVQKFKKFYFNLCKKTLGGNLNSKRFYQPLTYAFVDYAATKFSDYVIPEARNELPHIHALMMSHPKYSDRIWNLFNDPIFGQDQSITFFEKPDFQKVDSDKGTAEEVLSYSMKGLNSTNHSNSKITTDWDIMPF